MRVDSSEAEEVSSDKASQCASSGSKECSWLRIRPLQERARMNLGIGLQQRPSIHRDRSRPLLAVVIIMGVGVIHPVRCDPHTHTRLPLS